MHHTRTTTSHLLLRNSIPRAFLNQFITRRYAHTNAALEATPLFPSVRRLLIENKLDEKQITPSGK